MMFKLFPLPSLLFLRRPGEDLNIPRAVSEPVDIKHAIQNSGGMILDIFAAPPPPGHLTV